MSNETQLRIINNFSNIKEHGFYSESVQNAIDSFNNIKTLKELIEMATPAYQNQIRDTFSRDMRRDVTKYNEFLKRMERLENTFSFDIDYI